MLSIGILTSTAPLRNTSTRHGVTKQRLNHQACNEIASNFDVVIVGSTSSDEVFAHIARNLPSSVRSKFRFYSRGFFHSFLAEEYASGRRGADPRDSGWQAILAENHIAFEPFITRRANHEVKFNWHRIGQFITDSRVTLITGAEGQLFLDCLRDRGK